MHLTGNTVIDALLQTVRPDYRFRTPALAALDPARRLVLVTTHRRESFGAPLRSICAAIRELAERFPELQFVLPVHPNPEVKRTVEELLCDLPGMHLIPPVDYLEFVHLMARADLVLTDSGGVQEEAPSLGKPVLVLREVTERPEGVEAGTARVVGTDRARIVAAATELLTSPEAYARMANAVNPYGDGRASERILRGARRNASDEAAGHRGDGLHRVPPGGGGAAAWGGGRGARAERPPGGARQRGAAGPAGRGDHAGEHHRRGALPAGDAWASPMSSTSPSRCARAGRATSSSSG